MQSDDAPNATPKFQKTITETSGIVKSDDQQRLPGDQISFENSTPVDSFAHRRLMAWVALISILGLTLLIIFHINPDKVSAYDALFGWVYGTLSAIILSYMGVTAFSYSSWLKNTK